jgi:D-3-phosphoglycerate dehydrogenase
VRAIATRGDLGASAGLMTALPKLEIVACYGVGTDAIDLTHARTAGIPVTNTPDVLTDDVADIAVALLLAAARRLAQGDAEVRGGGWAMPLTTRVSGKRVGIVGMGRIGVAVARRAGFDADIVYFGRTRHHLEGVLDEGELPDLEIRVEATRLATGLELGLRPRR